MCGATFWGYLHFNFDLLLFTRHAPNPLNRLITLLNTTCTTHSRTCALSRRAGRVPSSGGGANDGSNSAATAAAHPNCTLTGGMFSEFGGRDQPRLEGSPSPSPTASSTRSVLNPLNRPASLPSIIHTIVYLTCNLKEARRGGSLMRRRCDRRLKRPSPRSPSVTLRSGSTATTRRECTPTGGGFRQLEASNFGSLFSSRPAPDSLKHPAELIRVIIATTAYTHADRKRSQPALLPTFPPCGGNRTSTQLCEQFLPSICLKLGKTQTPVLHSPSRKSYEFNHLFLP
ncbi:hypothetical protein JCM6882_004738 [Rhodosporidiobolus microsporus]